MGGGLGASELFIDGPMGIVADEQIGHAQCKWIKRTACRNAKLAKAGAAKILDRSKKTSSNRGCGHKLTLPLCLCAVILNEVKDLPISWLITLTLLRI